MSVASRVPPDLRGTVILLGNFDGLHAGHHALLTAARTVAMEGNRITAGETLRLSVGEHLVEWLG